MMNGRISHRHMMGESDIDGFMMIMLCNLGIAGNVSSQFESDYLKAAINWRDT